MDEETQRDNGSHSDRGETTPSREVLLLEDDPSMAEMLTGMVKSVGNVSVRQVDSAEAALALAVGRHFDLVILDDLVAGPTRGSEIVPALRSVRPLSRLLLFSASAPPVTDVDANISKFDVPRLLPTVRSFLGL